MGCANGEENPLQVDGRAGMQRTRSTTSIY